MNLRLVSSQTDNHIYTTSADEATKTSTSDHTTSADASHCKEKALINNYYYETNATEAINTNYTTSADDTTEATTTSYNTSDDEATTTEYASENTQGVVVFGYEPQTVKDCPVDSGNFR